MSTLSALSNDLAGAAERAGRAVVAVHGRQHRPSSGVLWQPNVIVTAEHTLKRDEEITVTLPDGSNVPAVLAGRDAGTDLAVLKADTGKTAAAELGDSRCYPFLLRLRDTDGGNGDLDKALKRCAPSNEQDSDATLA